MMTLEIENLSYQYDQSQNIRFPSIQIDKNQALLILGNSGKGKTTLLHLIAGLLRSNKGSIKVDGVDLNSLKGHQLDTFRGKNMGVIFQKSYFLKGLTARQNVLVAALAAEQKQDEEYINSLFKTLGLTDKQHKKTYQLSIGEQQRVNIIRALVNKPKILLADEPTSALDDDNCKEVVKVLQEAAAINNSALVIVTHDSRLKQIFKNVVEL